MKFTWGHGIIVFFVIFFTWIISFVIFTLGENNDLVTPDYYRQGAEYTKKMDIDKRSALYKDSITIANSNQGVTINMAPSLGNLSSDKEIYFYRPSGEKHDLKTKVMSGKRSAFIDNKLLIKGRYRISISWKQNTEKYIVSKDFVVR